MTHLHALYRKQERRASTSELGLLNTQRPHTDGIKKLKTDIVLNERRPIWSAINARLVPQRGVPQFLSSSSGNTHRTNRKLVAHTSFVGDIALTFFRALNNLRVTFLLMRDKYKFISVQRNAKLFGHFPVVIIVKSCLKCH